MTTPTGAPSGAAPAAALAGLRVLDISTLFAGPMCATLLGDYGAEVIKVESPDRPDAARGHGFQKDGTGLWWKSLGRNKETVALNLKSAEGRDLLLRLVEDVDIVVENFRPDTLSSWGLGYEHLSAVNPGLIMVSVTGFGQFGPKSSEPGFGTLAEAMSGFAAMTGQPDGPPTLPPLALADSVAGMMAAFAAMTAVYSREQSGRGQQIDVSLIEPMLAALGPQVTVFDQLGVIAKRLGNRSENNAPRNLYRTSDDRWLAVSTSSQSIAERVIALVGREDLISEPWFSSAKGRVGQADLLDDAVASWVLGKTAAEALEAFRSAHAAASLVYNAEDIINDAQYQALGAVAEVPDEDLGPVKMLNVPFRMSRTPGGIRWTGRGHGADTEAVLERLGLSAEEIAGLRDRKVIA
ncbi:CoA transferase [Cellulosimicrobium funkei]|nr:CoA transferase [Cellulosimicrobium funkei]